MTDKHRTCHVSLSWSSWRLSSISQVEVKLNWPMIEIVICFNCSRLFWLAVLCRHLFVNGFVLVRKVSFEIRQLCLFSDELMNSTLLTPFSLVVCMVIKPGLPLVSSCQTFSTHFLTWVGQKMAHRQTWKKLLYHDRTGRSRRLV